jgi:hypothetical protein
VVGDGLLGEDVVDEGERGARVVFQNLRVHAPVPPQGHSRTVHGDGRNTDFHGRCRRRRGFWNLGVCDCDGGLVRMQTGGAVCVRGE